MTNDQIAISLKAGAKNIAFLARQAPSRKASQLDSAITTSTACIWRHGKLTNDTQIVGRPARLSLSILVPTRETRQKTKRFASASGSSSTSLQQKATMQGIPRMQEAQPAAGKLQIHQLWDSSEKPFLERVNHVSQTPNLGLQRAARCPGKPRRPLHVLLPMWSGPPPLWLQGQPRQDDRPGPDAGPSRQSCKSSRQGRVARQLAEHVSARAIASLHRAEDFSLVARDTVATHARLELECC